MEELAIESGPHFVNDSGFKVDKHITMDVVPGTSFTEKGVESIVTSTNSLITKNLAMRLDAMLEAVKFSAGIANLDSGLTDVDRDALPHF